VFLVESSIGRLSIKGLTAHFAIGNSEDKILSFTEICMISVAKNVIDASWNMCFMYLLFT
jgi:hypothetical protein